MTTTRPGVDPVVARYAARMRRSRVRYAAVLTVVVIALVAFAAVVVSRGEAAHATLRTTGHPPSPVRFATPSPVQQLAWRSTDRLASGVPLVGGTVATYSAHTVGGRAAVSGRQTWTYTRTDRTVCTAVQIGGATIAFFAVHGNCDEVTALDTRTGQRRWTRTLDKDGMPVNGRPTLRWDNDTLLVTSPSVIYAIAVSDGQDRWTYTRQGCTIASAVLGSAGALFSQSCTKPQCTSRRFCRSGVQLVLRAGTDDSGKPNADRFRWLDAANADIPVSAGAVIAAANPYRHTLELFAASGGAVLGSVPLAAGSSLATSQPMTTDTADVAWFGGRVYALPPGRTTVLWTAATAAPPTVIDPAGNSSATLSTARITEPVAGGVAVLDGDTGAVRMRIPVPNAGTTGPVTASSVALPIGTGFVVAGRSGMVVSR